MQYLLPAIERNLRQLSTHNHELDIDTQFCIEEGIWLPFGVCIREYAMRPITVLPNGKHVVLQGKVYWLSEFIGDDDDEIDRIMGEA